MQPVRMWMGLVLVGLGGVGLLGATGVLDAAAVTAQWWPLAVIGLGLAAALAQRALATGPVVVTAIGVALLAGAQDWAVQEVVWPALLIVVGLLVLSGLARRRAPSDESAAPAILGGSTVRSTSEHFDHAEVSAVFGGATLDLRGAHIDQHARVDALALFGAPVLTVDATAVFGGVSVTDKPLHGRPAPAPAAGRPVDRQGQPELRP
ncbi:hypothetical protein I4I73_08615 [Pseudonocardia sp. KRD-184]|uniref:LiaF transmembrane domain-containing protein n=1 Tax=Pseudonocardia oceani TaxID=2792013 RepID=A0ABS6UHJ7_9PSEU|nr:cell wall-active antibiotics response protein [Pseudonocardia oceani]MBW0093224.1 hypothetical protein [Pseudonocardia oceani]MBW0096050.1 hypothetical protein [Pseudonocardia oceani]MBW0110501.1 hypothetical protein [Pseudonocardia oceani]MBW0122925.1 hypothetical protein [Pseudonocardia oceani]MBW0131712.1 hypothetical protein [Pseudonocardia oceani]